MILFALDRDRSMRTSPALWLAVMWLAIAGSRNVSEWLQLGNPVDASDRYMEGSPVDRNVLMLIMAIGVITLAQRTKRMQRILRANAPVIAYFVLCGVSFVWSDFPLISLKRWFRGLGDIVIVLVILTDPNPIMAIKRVFTRLAFVLLPVSVLFIRYYPEYGRAYGMDGSQYWTGVSGGKNGLGVMCLMYGIAVIWRWIIEYQAPKSRARTRRLIALTITSVIAMWLLWIADSKTSLASLALVTGLIAVIGLFRVGRKRAVIHAMVLFIVSACFSVLFLGIGSSALQVIGRDPSLTGRTDVWKLVLSFAVNPIVGAGYESFWLGQRLIDIIRINGGINQAHNGYIEVYLNLGAAGLAALAGIIVTGYRKIVAGFRLNPQLSMLRLAYFVIAIVYNFTEGSFKMMSSVWIGFLFANMALPETWKTMSRKTVVSGVSESTATGFEPAQIVSSPLHHFQPA
ncbi:MAG TPA: O-antigen ligase family protein [Bryobacteraceae bacterium]|nr:O-antigen ligase family protein [Bryobacteraceae bacterium]